MKINCDLGEGFEDVDSLLIPLVDQASIASGGHTGDEASMTRCIKLAKLHHTDIGIHPSYPDRENFGRKSLTIPLEDLRKNLRKQIEYFLALCKKENAVASYVKAHGALYNDLAKDKGLLELFMNLVAGVNQQQSLETPLAVMLSASLCTPEVIELARKLNLSLLFEAFADRAYCDDGSLLARSELGAVLHDPAAIVAQFSSLADKSGVTTVTGNWLELRADTVCVHGDNPAVVPAIKTLKNLA